MPAVIICAATYAQAPPSVQPGQEKVEPVRPPQIPDQPVDQTSTPQAHSHQSDDDTKINIFTGLAHSHDDVWHPLTGKQRWELFLNQTFLPSAYFGIAWSSVVDHLGNAPPQWGQGAAGLGRRIGSRFAGNLVGNALYAGGAALTGEDPRYICSAKKGFWPRTGHAALYTVMTYNRDGKLRPAYAGIGSQYASSVITQLWQPEHGNLWKDGVRDGTVQLGFAVMFNVIEEFWPELTHLVRWKSRSAAKARAPGTP